MAAAVAACLLLFNLAIPALANNNESLCIYQGQRATLLQCLLQNYPLNEAPMEPAPTPVFIHPIADNLLGVDDRAQTVFMHMFHWIVWYDKRLAFETTSYNTTSSNEFRVKDTSLQLELPIDRIWLPRIDVRQSLSVGPYASLLRYQYARVDARGRIVAAVVFAHPWSCKMKMRRYPLDRQRCPYTLSGYSTTNLSLPSGSELESFPFRFMSSVERVEKYYATYGQVSPSAFDTGEWHAAAKRLFQTFAEAQVHYMEKWDTSYVTVVIELERSGTRHFIVWVGPAVLIAVGSVPALFFGVESSERFGFGASASVTLTLLLIGINEQLPLGDDGVPVISKCRCNVGEGQEGPRLTV